MFVLHFVLMHTCIFLKLFILKSRASKRYFSSEFLFYTLVITRIHCITTFTTWKPCVIARFSTSVESNAKLLWFCITTRYDWFKKLAPPSQPIRCKIKTNRDLVARVFPRFAPVTCICFEFSLVCFVVYVCCDLPLFGFATLN